MGVALNWNTKCSWSRYFELFLGYNREKLDYMYNAILEDDNSSYIRQTYEGLIPYLSI